MTPTLSAVVVHWHDEGALAQLASIWPADPRFELVVVDNGSDRPLARLLPDHARLVEPGKNLGFAGGANRGVEEARGGLLLLMNPDARPASGDPVDDLKALITAFVDHPDAGALAPRMESLDGEPQWRWQLRRLPRPLALLGEAFFRQAGRPLEAEPAAGAAVEQPAAAALAFRRSAWERVGGMDAALHPAWFEDVDLARRWRDAGVVVRYAPAARFVHGLGGTVPSLGYGTFLWLYARNLHRYLAKHHGRAWALAYRLLLPVGTLSRLVLLPLRTPGRAASRRAAARALWDLGLGGLTAFRLPTRERLG
jgi:GT2 family glycosyltransferase